MTLLTLPVPALHKPTNQASLSPPVRLSVRSCYARCTCARTPIGGVTGELRATPQGRGCSTQADQAAVQLPAQIVARSWQGNKLYLHPFHLPPFQTGGPNAPTLSACVVKLWRVDQIFCLSLSPPLSLPLYLLLGFSRVPLAFKRGVTSLLTQIWKENIISVPPPVLPCLTSETCSLEVNSDLFQLPPLTSLVSILT